MTNDIEAASVAMVSHEPDIIDVVPRAAISLDESRRRFEEFVTFVRGQMVDGEDMGTIPGTQKPTLLKPGAEKLCNFFGFAIEQDVAVRTEQWDRAIPFFHYEVRVTLRNKRTGLVEAQGVGSCNSMESKYRWRTDRPGCPECGKDLRRSRERPEWYCWRRMGGCGATFPIDQFSEERIENPDTADLVNTILKMAAKRALTDAVLHATRGSGLFTQDIEDMPAAAANVVDEPGPVPPQPRQEPPAARSGADRASPRPTQNMGQVMKRANDELGLMTREVREALGVDPRQWTGTPAEAWERILAHMPNIQAEAADEHGSAEPAPAQPAAQPDAEQPAPDAAQAGPSRDLRDAVRNAIIQYGIADMYAMLAVLPDEDAQKVSDVDGAWQWIAYAVSRGLTVPEIAQAASTGEVLGEWPDENAQADE